MCFSICVCVSVFCVCVRDAAFEIKIRIYDSFSSLLTAQCIQRVPRSYQEDK